MLLPWLLVAVAGASAPPDSIDPPEAVVRQFITAIYSNDRKATQGAAISNVDVSPLLGSQRFSFAELNQIVRDAKAMQLDVVQPFNVHGKLVETANGQYPVGTRVVYTSSFRGTPLVIPVMRTSAGWRIDPRWWLAMRAQGPDGEVPRDSPQFSVKALLIALVKHDRDGARELLTPGGDISLLFEGAPHEPDYSDQVVALAMEMPLVEIPPTERYRLPGGEVVEGSRKPDHEKLLVGFYGSTEVPFMVRRVGSQWRVVPQPYFRILEQR